jgi:hypothetical protein
VDLPAASIPIGLRKDPCSDSAGRNHARLSCLSEQPAILDLGLYIQEFLSCLNEAGFDPEAFRFMNRQPPV